MATRSIIAVGTRQSFKGVYCHFDGYDVDRDLATIFRSAGREHAKEVLRFLVNDHPEGWSAVLTELPGTSDWPNVRIPHTQFEGHAYKDRLGDDHGLATFTQDDLPRASQWMDYLHIVNRGITIIRAYRLSMEGQAMLARTTYIWEETT